jgi:DNA-binding transcriptional regulator/RsmH inhibitor MraZ
MRAIILSEELLSLPARFNKFLREEFRPLKEKTAKIEKDIEVLKADVKVLKQDVAVLKEDVRGLKVDVGSLKGEMFEMRVINRAHALFGKLLRKTRVIVPQDYTAFLDDAIDAGLISVAERDDAINADVVVKGKMKDSGKEVILVAEASVTVDLFMS